jgi:hypothetical protein
MSDQRGCLASGQITEKKALQLGLARVTITRTSFSHEILPEKTKDPQNYLTDPVIRDKA